VYDQIGSPTYTRDLSQAISTLVQKEAQGIFHVSNEGSCSWFTFAEKILRYAGIQGVQVVPLSSKELNRPARRPSYSVFNMEKFMKKTGRRLRPWSEALKDFLLEIGKWSNLGGEEL